MSVPQRIKRKKYYYHLAECLRLAGRWSAIGNERWADCYRSEASRLRRKGVPVELKPSSLIDCFIFYPDENGWSKTHVQSTDPENIGIITEGMQDLIDGLLGKESQSNFRQAA